MPVTAAITAVAEAAKALFTFLATEQGQETVKEWRANRAEFNRAIDTARKWVEGLLQ